jgi:ABC-type nitrate/sulfonate/bicarbonate transport system substrate-binding protein
MIIFPFKRMAALVCCLIVTGVFWSARVSAKTVTFAYNTPTLSGTLPIVVAQDFGFFAAEGLEGKTVFIRGGPTWSVEGSITRLWRE